MGGPVKPGSWGDRMVIIRNHIPYKNISCAACTYYCIADKSCLKTARIPRIDGWQAWRKCDWFDLDIDYMDEEHMAKVREVKGESFFERSREVLAEQLETEKKTRVSKQKKRLIQPVASVEKADLYIDKIKSLLENQMQICFKKEELPCSIGFNGCCLHSVYETGEGRKEVIIIAIEKLSAINCKHRIFKTVDHWLRDMNNAVFLLQKYKSGAKKYLIVPEITTDEAEDTIAEIYYKKRGDRLGKIELVELRKNGLLALPIGPIERKDVMPKGTIWKNNSGEE